MAASPLKVALEDLLRQRRLPAESATRYHGDRRHVPFTCGLEALDGLLSGGLPRGQISEIHGPASAGRTALALRFLAEATGRGSLVAWVDSHDQLDPASALATGIDLPRLLWLRGGRDAALERMLPATATLLCSGLFELVVLDLAAVSAKDVQRLPAATWIRLHRLIEGLPTALILVGQHHVVRSPAGVSLSLKPAAPRWGGGPGPGCLLSGLVTEAAVWGPSMQRVDLELLACR